MGEGTEPTEDFGKAAHQQGRPEECPSNYRVFVAGVGDNVVNELACPRGSGGGDRRVKRLARVGTRAHFRVLGRYGRGIVLRLQG